MSLPSLLPRPWAAWARYLCLYRLYGRDTRAPWAAHLYKRTHFIVRIDLLVFNNNHFYTHRSEVVTCLLYHSRSLTLLSTRTNPHLVALLTISWTSNTRVATQQELTIDFIHWTLIYQIFIEDWIIRRIHWLLIFIDHWIGTMFIERWYSCWNHTSYPVH